jgi:hypothetical protein
MDHQFIIDAGKEALLEMSAGALPTTHFFFAEYDGHTTCLVIPPCSCGDMEYHCFDIARQTAMRHQWKSEKLAEIAYVGFEQGNKDILVVAFCKPGLTPAFSVYSIEIRRAGGRMVLLDDSDEVTTEQHHLLNVFSAGAVSAPLSDADLALLRAMVGEEE